MDHFLDKIKNQLKLMAEDEKDAWILSQAKILPDWRTFTRVSAVPRR